MNPEIVWKTEKWTVQARQLIEALKKFPKDSKLILMLRHSHRGIPESKEIILTMGITTLGYEIAKIFGEKLPSYRPIRLFYSVVNRCRETAEAIFEGFNNISTSGQVVGPCKPLYDLGTTTEFHLQEATKYSQQKFLMRWAAGLYPWTIITPFTVYCQNAAKIFRNQINMAPSKCIDIYISHDIILMGMRLGWFGFSPNEKWISFLGGFAFTVKNKEFLLFDINTFKTSEIPYWWKD